MNRDEIKGKAEKAKGYIKEEAGEALNDPELEAEGRGERRRPVIPPVFAALS
jgi:uncharacterized protein YjbJ (UPF0337 family)